MKRKKGTILNKGEIDYLKVQISKGTRNKDIQKHLNVCDSTIARVKSKYGLKRPGNVYENHMVMIQGTVCRKYKKQVDKIVTELCKLYKR